MLIESDVNMIAFCNNCKCKDCQFGTDRLYHAQTANGDWICDVCYTYDVCTSGPNRNPNGPCKRKDCKHRPKLVSKWLQYKGTNK